MDADNYDSNLHVDLPLQVDDDSYVHVDLLMAQMALVPAERLFLGNIEPEGGGPHRDPNSQWCAPPPPSCHHPNASSLEPSPSDRQQAFLGMPHLAKPAGMLSRPVQCLP